jgi:hypothetical protein
VPYSLFSITMTAMCSAGSAGAATALAPRAGASLIRPDAPHAASAIPSVRPKRKGRRDRAGRIAIRPRYLLARQGVALHRGEWRWVEERITGLLDSNDGRSLFVEWCVINQSEFYDRFNAVVLLSAPADVILDRVARRTTNTYGKTPLERAMILDDLARIEPLLRVGCTHELDASRPLADRSPTSSPN